MEHGHDAPLQIDVSWDGVVAMVTATGELDIGTATPLTAACWRSPSSTPTGWS